MESTSRRLAGLARGVLQAWQPAVARRRTTPPADTRTTAASTADGPRAVDTSRGLPPFDYSPHLDGDADPGEVVWTWVPYEDDPSRGKDRPVLVLGRAGPDVIVAQLSSQDHDLDAADEARWGRYWMDIGAGAWDARGQPSEVRLDRLLRLPRDKVRREGGILAEGTFRQVMAAVQDLHGRG